MTSSPHLILFTDLDGTLLDPFDFSWDAAQPALQQLYLNKVPIVFCTGKTRRETVYYRSMTGVEDPFIVENGAAIFVPFGYFDSPVSAEMRDGYEYVEMGHDRSGIHAFIADCQREVPGRILSREQMEGEKLQQISRLSGSVAQMMAAREYGDFFYFDAPSGEPFPQKVLAMAGERNLQIIKDGLFHYVSGSYDKGQAIRKLKALYERDQPGRWLSAGIGDANSDYSLLKNVDYPYLVKNYRDTYDALILNQIEAELAGDIGPRGWALAVNKILASHET